MDEEYKRIRSNFVVEMQNKIDKYKLMKQNVVAKCVEDCQKNLKLRESEKPEKTIWSRMSQKSREADKQVIKDSKCAHLANKPFVCQREPTTTPNTKVLFGKLEDFENEIRELFEMYEKEQTDVDNEERKFTKGLIDIRFQNVEGEFKTAPVSQYASVLDVKNQYDITGDLVFNDKILEDDETLRSYLIKSGSILLIIPKMGGAAKKKRKTMRRPRKLF